jgi:hypothetical protein
MKKLGLVMAVLMVATPVWARVDITCTAPADSCDVTVSYKVVGESNSVRGFALDIMIDQGAVIKEVYMNSLDPNYWVYPGSIVINTTTNPPTVSDKGTPVANPYDPCLPGQTLLGLDSNGVTIEMGSLYWPTGDNSPNAPKISTKFKPLLKFRVSKKPTCVTIRENAIRGGVVLTNPNANPDVNSPGVGNTPKYCLTGGPLPCLPNTVPYYQQWLDRGVLLGMPAGQGPTCWCYPRQCYGDADGIKTGSSVTGYTYVGPTDLVIFSKAYNVKEPPKGLGIATVTNGICADFAHDKTGSSVTGYTYVGPTDLAIFSQRYNVKEPPKGVGVPSDCGGSLVPP